MLHAVKEKLSEFSVLKESPLSYPAASDENPQNIHKKMRLTQIEEEIGNLLSKVAEAEDVLMKYINEKVSELDIERKVLQEELAASNVTAPENRLNQITNHAIIWETLSFSDKQAVMDVLVTVIRIADGRLEITWNL